MKCLLSVVPVRSTGTYRYGIFHTSTYRYISVTKWYRSKYGTVPRITEYKNRESPNFFSKRKFFSTTIQNRYCRLREPNKMLPVSGAFLAVIKTCPTPLIIVQLRTQILFMIEIPVTSDRRVRETRVVDPDLDWIRIQRLCGSGSVLGIRIRIQGERK
jgi:hypothetical protein